jgi:hypothetical protein
MKVQDLADLIIDPKKTMADILAYRNEPDARQFVFNHIRFDSCKGSSLRSFVFETVVC